MHLKSLLKQSLLYLFSLLEEHCLLSLIGYRDDYNLDDCNSRGQHQPYVIAVEHDHDADGSSRQPPRSLPHQRLFVLFVQKLYLEHLGKVLAQLVAGRGLNASAVLVYPGLDRSSVEGPGELLGLGLCALNHRDCKEVLVNLPVELENCVDKGIGFGLCSVGSMALLPEEFAGANERRRMLELPPDDAGPLVEQEGKVPVTLDPLGVGRVHDGFAGGSDGDWLLHFLVA